jgi:transcriptional regulator with XRE-family HTH domain
MQATNPRSGDNELGDLLRQARASRGLSLRAVARAAGFAATYLQRLETGENHHPSPAILAGLSAALELEFETLLALAGHPGAPGASVDRDAGLRLLTRLIDVSALDEDQLRELAEYAAYLRFRGRSRRGRARRRRAAPE